MPEGMPDKNVRINMYAIKASRWSVKNSVRLVFQIEDRSKKAIREAWPLAIVSRV